MEPKTTMLDRRWRENNETPPPQRLRKKGRGKKDATNFFNKNKCYIMMEIIQATAFSVQNLATQKKKEVGTAKNQQASNQPFIF